MIDEWPSENFALRTTPFRLTDLPLETRQQIYGLCLDTPAELIHRTDDGFREFAWSLFHLRAPRSPLLLLCKAIYLEVVPMTVRTSRHVIRLKLKWYARYDFDKDSPSDFLPLPPILPQLDANSVEPIRKLVLLLDAKPHAKRGYETNHHITMDSFVEIARFLPQFCNLEELELCIYPSNAYACFEKGIPEWLKYKLHRSLEKLTSLRSVRIPYRKTHLSFWCKNSTGRWTLAAIADLERDCRPGFWYDVIKKPPKW